MIDTRFDLHSVEETAKALITFERIYTTLNTAGNP